MQWSKKGEAGIDKTHTLQYGLLFKFVAELLDLDLQYVWTGDRLMHFSVKKIECNWTPLSYFGLRFKYFEMNLTPYVSPERHNQRDDNNKNTLLVFSTAQTYYRTTEMCYVKKKLEIELSAVKPEALSNPLLGFM